MQRMLWLSEQISAGASAYNLPRVLLIKGALQAETLRATFQTLLRRHAALRTSFVECDGDILQEIHHDVAIDLASLNLTGLPEAQRMDEALRLAAEQAGQKFDLGRAPLMRLLLLRIDADRHVLVLVIHHIITDGWSMSIIFDELAEFYESIAGGGVPGLPPPKLQFADFAAWEQEHLTGPGVEADLAYWRSVLQGCPESLELPYDHARPAARTQRGATHGFVIAPDVAAGLEALCQRERATLYMGLLTVFQILLSRYSHRQDIPVGTPVVGRNDPDLAGVVGCFVNTLVMRTDLSGDPSFSHALLRVREVVLGALDHQELSFQVLLAHLPPRQDREHAPIFQVMLILHNGPRQVTRLAGLEIEELAFSGGMTKFDLTLEVVTQSGGLYCQFEYSTDLFEAATIERMAGHFANLLSGAVHAPETPISRLPLLDQEQRMQILVEWNRTEAAYDRDQRIEEAFADAVQRAPHAIALIEGDRRVTYAELDRRADSVAQALRWRGMPRDEAVGVHLGRSVDAFAAILGTLKAGFPYVPLDTAQPAARLHRLIADCGCAVVLTRRGLIGALPASVDAIAVDADEPARQGPPAPAGDVPHRNLAYIIYTSGSTGDPKGVMGGHRATQNRFDWMYRAYPFAPGEVCCQKTSLGFVDSIWEMLGPLLRGVPIVIADDDDVMDPRRLIALLAEAGVTRLVLVPALLQVLLDHAPDLGARLPALWHWTTSGDYLSAELARRFHAACPGAVLLNLYGSSEVAADVTAYEVRQLHGNRPVPIGKPISNTRVYVLDQHLEPVPIGVSGQIHVGGDCLSAGYWRRPDLTAERFVASPFDGGASKLFATGDQGRFLADGTVEYLGRQDRQIKIRGYRVELGEVEAHLAAHPGVAQAAVACTAGPLGEARDIVAYVVGQGGAAPPAEALRAFLATRLPRYMVPAIFVELPALPMLPSGKIDCRALPAPPSAGGESTSQNQEPRNETEAELASLWRELLHIGKIGVAQNFFDLGGNSLLAMQLLARIRRQFDVDIAVRLLFETPTIEALAREIAAARQSGAKPRRARVRPLPRQQPNLDALAAELGKLTPEQIERLLGQVRGS